MSFSCGLSALIRCAAALELELPSLETLSIGTVPNSPAGNYYEAEIAGRHLLFTVSLIGEQVLVSASLADSVDEPEVLLKAHDIEAEWLVVFHLISALEKAGVKSLTRPIEAIIADDPEHSWIIC